MFFFSYFSSPPPPDQHMQRIYNRTCCDTLPGHVLHGCRNDFLTLVGALCANRRAPAVLDHAAPHVKSFAPCMTRPTTLGLRVRVKVSLCYVLVGLLPLQPLDHAWFVFFREGERREKSNPFSSSLLSSPLFLAWKGEMTNEPYSSHSHSCIFFSEKKRELFTPTPCNNSHILS